MIERVPTRVDFQDFDEEQEDRQNDEEIARGDIERRLRQHLDRKQRVAEAGAEQERDHVVIANGISRRGKPMNT